MHRNISLRGVRFNWLNVMEPSYFKPGDPGRYRAEVIIEPGSEADTVLKDALASAAEEKWPGKGEGMIAVAESNKKCCRKDGDTMPLNKKTMAIPEYYLGNTILSTSRVEDRDGAPKVYSERASSGSLVEVSKDTTFDEDLIKPVSGNYGDVMVSLWGWEHSGSPQINCTLDAIAFRRTGDALGGHAPVSTGDIAAAFGAEIEDPFSA
jgi:hypothetical protein